MMTPNEFALSGARLANRQRMFLHYDLRPPPHNNLFKQPPHDYNNLNLLTQIGSKLEGRQLYNEE